MSAPKFSPGPWHFREGRTLSGQFGYIEAANHNRIVADLPDYKGGSDIECDEPNGRLIAAAPELYEALHELLACHASGGFVEPDASVLDAARAALAKAVQS